MVIPAIGVVIGDDDRCRRPLGALHHRIDDLHDEALLIDWIGVAGMAIFVSGRLEEGDGRQVIELEGSEEIGRVVLVVRGIWSHTIGFNRAPNGNFRAGRRCLRLAVLA